MEFCTMGEVSSNDGEKLAFLNGLKQYLEDKGRVLVPYPRLAGKVIDLHDLYNRVTSLGGYQKVTERELWETFLADYNFDVVSSTLCFGLKTIYQRFLEAYESVHYFGDEESSKRSHFDVSLRYSRRPAYISEHDRAQHGLNTTRLSEARFAGNSSDYERLVFSLVSCLPNEVDFAINACTLLSGESRHVLRLSRCPQILEALLLHAGIVSDENNSYASIANEWNKKTKHDLIQFWKDTTLDEDVLHNLLLVQLNLSMGDVQMKNKCNNADSTVSLNSLPKTREHPKTWSSLFQCKRSPGVQDYEGQRILQIALVLLNLSFERFNVPLLAKSKAFLRFVFLCIHSNYGALRQTGLDILGNISPQLNLLDLGLDITQCMYKTVESCILSLDKFDQIRGLEILGKLCRSPSNKDGLIVLISEKVYNTAVRILTILDVELVLAALEALYGMSKLGPETCTRIMLISGSIDILISLVTINVRDFGTANLARIRIAKRVPPVVPSQPVHQHPPQRVITPHLSHHGHLVHPPSVYQPKIPSQHVYRPAVNTYVHPQVVQPPPAQQPAYRHPRQPPPAKPLHATVPVYTHTESHSTPPVYHYMPAPPADIILDKSPESFAKLWAWASYKSCPNDEGSVPRVQVFADYAAAASRYGMCGTKQVLPASEFGRCLQQVFPHTASRLFNDSNGQPMYHITGIQKRATPLPVPGHHPQDVLTQSKPVAADKPTSKQPVVVCTGVNPKRTIEVVEQINPNVSSKTLNHVKTAAVNTSSIEITPTSTKEENSMTNSNYGELHSTDPSIKNEVLNDTNLTDSSGARHSNSSLDTGDIDSKNVRENCDDQGENMKQCTSSSVSNLDEKLTNSADVACIANPMSTKNCKLIYNHTFKNHTNPFIYSVKQEWRHTNNIDHNDVEFNPKSNSDKLANGTNQATHKMDVSLKEKAINNNSSVISSKTVNSTEAALCNGEVDHDHETKCNSAKDDEDSVANKEGVNGIHGHTFSHNGSKGTSVANGNCEPLKIRQIVVIDNPAQSHVQISPQTAPIAPTQLKHYYDSLKQSSQAKRTNTTVTDSTTNSLSSSSTGCSYINSTTSTVNCSPSLKRPLPSVVQQSPDAPSPAKISKSTAEITQALSVSSTTPVAVVPTSLNHPLPQHSSSSIVHSPARHPVPISYPVRTGNFSLPPTLPGHPLLPRQSHPQHHHPPQHPIHPPSDSSQAAQKKLPAIDLMAPNASLMVLFRNSGKHSFQDSSDENEDSISKSIRLTAVLILTNICRYSDEGRSLLQRHEGRLAYLTMSGMDSSPSLARLLGELDR
ncbi:uncharacterized protein LOC143453970 [Clavelina lepadiformis]|uniref:uncharacterized protein LOC143453970 n=1 Tax=Clavelina lepadiformis TaxID=159417 RepID=UPI0040411CEE